MSYIDQYHADIKAAKQKYIDACLADLDKAAEKQKITRIIRIDEYIHTDNRLYQIMFKNGISDVIITVVKPELDYNTFMAQEQCDTLFQIVPPCNNPAELFKKIKDAECRYPITRHI